MQSTDTPQLATDAPQVTAPGTLRPSAAQSPFGPQRKREEQPPTIPGQRKASDALPPRPAPPQQTLTARPLGRDPWDAHHADLAFGGAA